MRINFLVMIIISNLLHTVYASDDQKSLNWDMDPHVKHILSRQLEDGSLTLEQVQEIAGDFDLSKDGLLGKYYSNSDHSNMLKPENSFNELCSASANKSNQSCSSSSSTSKTNPLGGSEKVEEDKGDTCVRAVNRFLKSMNRREVSEDEILKLFYSLYNSHTNAKDEEVEKIINEANIPNTDNYSQDELKFIKLFVISNISRELFAQHPYQFDDSDYRDDKNIKCARINYENQCKLMQDKAREKSHIKFNESDNEIQDMDALYTILDMYMDVNFKDYQYIPRFITNLVLCELYIKNATDEMTKACELYLDSIFRNSNVDFYFNQFFKAKKKLKSGLNAKRKLEESSTQNIPQ